MFKHQITRGTIAGWVGAEALAKCVCVAVLMSKLSAHN